MGVIWNCLFRNGKITLVSGSAGTIYRQTIPIHISNISPYFTLWYVHLMKILTYTHDTYIFIHSLDECPSVSFGRLIVQKWKDRAGEYSQSTNDLRIVIHWASFLDKYVRKSTHPSPPPTPLKIPGSAPGRIHHLRPSANTLPLVLHVLNCVWREYYMLLYFAYIISSYLLTAWSLYEYMHMISGLTILEDITNSILEDRTLKHVLQNICRAFHDMILYSIIFNLTTAYL